MKITRGSFRPLAWLACLAILANILAPGVSHELAASAGRTWGLIELCTSVGIELVAIEGETGQPTPDKRHDAPLAGDCGYCLTHAGSFALPTSWTRFSVSVAPRAGQPSFAPPPAPRGPAWIAPPSRGPPRLA